jgi:hypothetical protein
MIGAKREKGEKAKREKDFNDFLLYSGALLVEALHDA